MREPRRPRPGKLGIGKAVFTAVAALATILFIFGPDWHWPVWGEQTGFPSGVQFRPDRALLAPLQVVPAALAAAKPDPRPATQAYKNVKVLTDLNAGEFMRVQEAMTAWVSPKQGCGFCHAGNDYASDANPHKLAARVMLLMTRHINADWQCHVAPAGVTCYTCHRGQGAPAEMWLPRQAAPVHAFVDRQEAWNEGAKTVRKFFPTDSWDIYLLEDTPGLAQSYTALPTGEVSAQIVTKRLYEFMIQMSDGIGVNCTYCHNSRAFFDWQQSTPARWSAYWGIRMTRDLNRNYLLKIVQLLPQSRTLAGAMREPFLPAREQYPRNGNGLAVCATCHYSLPRPLHGADMLKDYPALRGPGTGATPAAGTTGTPG